jgi:hypothetical protein
MREVWANRGNDSWLPAEKYGDFWVEMQNLVFCSIYNVSTLFEIYKRDF